MEDEVRDQIVAVLAGEGLAAAAAALRGDGGESRGLADELQADEAALKELVSDRYTRRIITESEFLHAREELNRRIAESRRTLGQLSSSRALEGLPTGQAELFQWWESAPSDARRAVASAVASAVVVAPANPRGPRRFTPDRVTVRWTAA